MSALDHFHLSEPVRFEEACWQEIPDAPGVYAINDLDEVIYVGMAGRNGRGSLRRRLRDHSTGQVVNMFAQYLFLARVQFASSQRITHPTAARHACRSYIRQRCSFRYRLCATGSEARELEKALKSALRPSLNP